MSDSNVVGRLRAMLRINALRWGSSDEEIEKALAMCEDRAAEPVTPAPAEQQGWRERDLFDLMIELKAEATSLEWRYADGIPLVEVRSVLVRAAPRISA